MVYKNLTNVQFKALDNLKRVRKNQEKSPNPKAMEKAQSAWDAVKPKPKAVRAKKNG